MDYLLVKQIHMASAAASFSLFLLRGIWMLRQSPRLRALWVRILPHLIDTLLLASAIALAVMSRQYPVEQHWLTAKVVALLLYIGLGMVALKRGRTRTVRTLAWLAALGVFVYIVVVAVSRNPLPGIHL
jgi:uncharacterized membrane protein SirB2